MTISGVPLRSVVKAHDAEIQYGIGLYLLRKCGLIQ
jgi:hypothetical protein